MQLFKFCDQVPPGFLAAIEVVFDTHQGDAAVTENGCLPFGNHMAVFGETFEIANVPDTVMFFVKGHAEPRLVSNSDGDRGADLVLSLDSFRTDSSGTASAAPSSRSCQLQPEAKSA